MGKFYKGIILIIALSCCLASRADKVLFDGKKDNLKNTVIKADPEKAENKTGLCKYPNRGWAVGFVNKDKDWSKYEALSFRI